MIRFLAVTTAVVCAPLLSACLPVIAHSPRLTPGISAGIVAGYETSTRPEPSPENVKQMRVPSMGVSLAASLVDSASGWGARTSITYRLLATQLDLFVRPPPIPHVNADVGVGAIGFIGGLAGWMPYVQVGVPITHRTYVYTTQGSVFVLREYGIQGFDHPWMSHVGLQLPSQQSLQVGALFGRMDDGCSGAPIGCWRPPRYFVQWIVPIRRPRPAFRGWRIP